MTPESAFNSAAINVHAPLGAVVVEQLLDSLAQAIEQRTMMRFSVERRNHFVKVVTARARRVKGGDIAGYIQAVLAPIGFTEFNSLIDDLTINETTFFRNVPQMNLFARFVVPEIIARKRLSKAPGRLEIWSAACSTGQEAYTLAILAYEALRFMPTWDVRVHATDISPSVIEVAQAGVYPKARLDTMPPDILRRYFDEAGDEIRVKDVLRRIVKFQQHNLRDPFPAVTFDVIFCRNVMIYFSREDQSDLARRFRERLAPEGFLFIGHSESLQGLDVDFRLRLQDGGVAYQRPPIN
jgi:chemotaxis protein methyltransferase CheR